MTDSTAQERLAADMADGLRALANAVDAHPELAEELRLQVKEGSLSIFPADRAELVALARMLKAHGAAITKDSSGDLFRAFGDFGPVRVRIVVQREQVCERVVVGTETVTEQVPDPALLAEVPLVKVTKTVEQVEWKCRPLLADEAESRVPVTAGTAVTS